MKDLFNKSFLIGFGVFVVFSLGFILIDSSLIYKLPFESKNAGFDRLLSMPLTFLPQE